jgi:FlaA1/EpsC-like NDP-sugar epimerase
VVYKVADILTPSLDRIFINYKPDIVFHASAYKHVPLMQENVSEALNNNLYGTVHAIITAGTNNCKNFVLISTDKAVNPTSIMGVTKRLCELVAIELQDRFEMKINIVRFGNVIQSNGSVINTFLNQIENGEDLTVTDKNIQRYFMTTREATELITMSSSICGRGEIALLDMVSPIKIYDLASVLIKFHNSKSGIKIIGLRDGDKMFEELSYNPNTMEKSENEHIFIIKDSKCEKFVLKEYMGILNKTFSYLVSDDEIIEYFKSLGFKI